MLQSMRSPPGLDELHGGEDAEEQLAGLVHAHPLLKYYDGLLRAQPVLAY